MLRFGYKLSSEEQHPNELVRYAQMAEDSGFDFVSISDHYHPWIDKQGHSPFVWSVIGAIAHATERIDLITGVTAPTIRTHPAIIAQATATAAAMMPGRFGFGVGSGENLNEHILGDHWPPAPVRIEMLEESIEVIRKLWKGKLTSHRGRYYTVENARLYTLPDAPPPIYIAASGKRSLTLAGEIGDGLIYLAPKAEGLEAFDKAGGAGKPKYCEITVCWAESEEEAKETAHEWWPVAGLQGQLMQEIALPSQFEDACAPIGVDEATKNVACGPDPDEHIAAIKEFVDAGFDHLWIHQVGPDQEGFFKFYEQNVLPKLR